MRRLQPLTLLFILLGVVPLIVGGSGLVSYLLWRAGYGFLAWGLLPFAASLLLIGVLGAVLGLAASGTRGAPEEKEGATHKGPRREDDV